MHRIILLLFVSMYTNLLFAQQEISVIPKPNKMEAGMGSFVFNDKTKFVSYSKDVALVMPYFYTKFTQAAGFQYSTLPASKLSDNIVEISVDTTLSKQKEFYSLSIQSKKIKINATDVRGVFYAFQTILQLLPPAIEAKTKQNNIQWAVPAVNIEDAPRFTWRGYMLDVCRHFIPVENIKKHLDMMAVLKMNKFHWHLTEDQAWRIEIKKYPQLLEFGARRKEANGSMHEGYYTQEQIKEVVAYAQARMIDVIPEIEMPGHALAALSAFPELSCTGGSFTPRIVWGVETDVYCAGNEKTFAFLEDVIKEVVPLFPYEYFHVGGDECPKDRWEVCKKCADRMQKENIKNAHDLQAYFIVRMQKVLAKYNKKMIGWDEILEGDIPTSANIMSWRGEVGGIEAANKGHDVVMSPGQWCYIDKYQGDYRVDPITIGGMLTTEKVYSYEPIPNEIAADKKKHILGAQANMWGEYVYTPEKAEFQTYPRLIALAEVGWTNPENKNYKAFEKRLNNMYPRMDAFGLNYYVPMPEGPGNHVGFTDTISLRFTTTLPVEKIVYTIGGNEPDLKSTVYTGPILVKENSIIKLRSVLYGNKMSPVRTVKVEKLTYSPASTKTDFKKGLRCNSVKGTFIKVGEIPMKAQWTELIVDSLAQIHKPKKWGFFVDSNLFQAKVITGYIDVPQDGIYYFSSDQDQVWIADKLVVNNDGLPKRFSQNDGAIALKKGKHALKIIFLFNIIDGWPGEWNTPELRYRIDGVKMKFKKVGGEMLFY